MANIFSRLFGTKKVDQSYQGNRPPSTSLDVLGGKDYYDTLYNRLMKRQDLGFGENYASQYSNPIIANMRNRFESYDMPALKNELSATGRRRGSAGFDSIRKAYEDLGYQTDDVFSKLQMRNEDQSRNELNDALASMGQLSQNELAQKNRLAEFDYRDMQRTWANQNARDAADSAMVGKVAQIGAMAASPMLSALSPVGASFASALPSYLQPMAQGAGNFMTQLASRYDNQNSQNSQLALLKQLLGSVKVA